MNNPSSGLLFPAYNQQKTNEEPKNDLAWLENPSFQASTTVVTPPPPVPQQPAPTKRSPSPERHHVPKPKKEKRAPEPPPPLSTKQREKILHQDYSKCTFIEETQLRPEQAFRLDSKPTKDNLAFKEVHYLKLAKYHKCKDVALGLSGTQSRFYLSELEKDQKKKKKKKPSKDRYFQNSLPRNALPITAKQNALPKGDFIPLKVAVEENPVEEVEDKSQPLNTHFERNSQFNRLLRENPKDEKLWMDFVNFQREFLGKEESEVAVMERRLAILDQAVEELPASISLHTLRLEVAQEVWEPAQLLEAWKKLVFIHPNNCSVWSGYILAVQSHLQHFSVPRATRLYRKCLATLCQVLRGQMASHPPPSDLADLLLELLYHYCSFLKQAGYVERALATLQAMVELNLCAMDQMQELSQGLPFLEAFWDSGVARFGESGALGWREVMKQGKLSPVHPVPTPELETEEQAILESCGSSGLGQAYLQLETLASTRMWQPWRPTSESDACNDPERMVSFDDLQEILFIAPHPERLPLFLLKLLGVDVPSPVLPEFSLDLLTSSGQDLAWDCGLDSEVLPQLTDHSHLAEVEPFLAQVFEQAKKLVPAPTRELLAWLQLRHFASQSPSGKEARRKAKQILKGTSEPPVWGEYVALCYRAFSQQEAEQTFRHVYAASVLQPSLCFLVAAYVRLLVPKDCIIAVNILAALGARESLPSELSAATPSATLLKAQRNFAQAVQRELDHPSPPILTCFPLLESLASCYGIFLYLTKGLAPALQMYESLLEKVASPAVVEQLELQASQLHSLDTWATPTASPAPLRASLSRSASRWPGNPGLLSLLLQLHKGSFLLGPTRSFFSGLVKQAQKQPQVWLAALAVEWRWLRATQGVQDAPVSDSGLCWRMRSLLAQSHRALPHCPLLWRLHLHFEMERGDSELARAALYRGLEQCPWDKGLYLDGAAFLPEEIETFVDTMVEKELRVRLVLQEVQLLLDHKFGSNES